MLSLIAVIGKNRELGKNNKLLWHLPGDLKRFRQITSGHPVIMGRKTFESLPGVLPNRTNIVISSQPSIPGIGPGIKLVRSLDEAIQVARTSPGAEEMFIIGGGSVYAKAIDQADRLYLTVVDKESPDADTFFPDYSKFKTVVAEEPEEADGYRYTFLTLTK